MLRKKNYCDSYHTRNAASHCDIGKPIADNASAIVAPTDVNLSTNRKFDGFLVLLFLFVFCADGDVPEPQGAYLPPGSGPARSARRNTPHIHNELGRPGHQSHPSTIDVID
jgi:hypothetical protein